MTVFAAIASSCSNSACDTVSCAAIFPAINFKIVNSSGQNLTCGPNKIYTSDKYQVKIFAGGVFYEQIKSFDGDSTLASTGIVYTASSLSDKYYLFINNVKTDSFLVSYGVSQSNSDCCPSTNQISQIKLNTTAVTIPFNVVK